MGFPDSLPAARSSRRLAAHHTALTGVAFVAPATVFLLVTLAYPVVYLLFHSLFQENFARPELSSQFVFLGNYVSLLGDPRFWNSVRVTVIFVAFAVSIELAIGLGVALLLQRVDRGRRILVALLLIPSMMMPIAVGLMWRYMFDDGYGMVAYYLKALHVLGPGGLIVEPLLVRPITALAALIVVDVWEWTPFMALILFAGLESLPDEPFEAAVVDGASPWQQFRFITLPLLRRAVAVAVLIRIADAMRVLDIVFSMTNGGPGTSTETVQLYSYNLGFGAFNTGLAFAQVTLVLIATLVVSRFIYRAIARQQEPLA